LVFPRINNGLNATLIYYDIRHISSEVACLSGKMTKAKVVDDKGKELPAWDEIVFVLHGQLEDEIQQIINLNYPHVRDMVLESLRDFIQTPPIKEVQKERITKLLLDFNASEEERILTRHPNGFSLAADPEFLPQYFIIVEKALNNLKRIVNRYLRLSDAGKLPITYQTPNYLPVNTQPVITDRQLTKKVASELNSNQLLYLFKALKECGIFHRSVKQSALSKLIANNFSSTNYEDLSAESLEKKWNTIDVNDIAFWNDKFPDLLNLALKDNPLKIKYKKKIDKDL
jgi:hypothetical protein